MGRVWRGVVTRGTLEAMRALAPALGLVLIACGPDFPPVIWSGDHLEYATDREDTLCEGTFTLQDRFIAQLAEFVGITLSEPIRFVYVDPSRVGDFCPYVPADGCARDDAVISVTSLSRHELAHAVTLAAGWLGPQSFVEGVAEMFSDGFDLDSARAPLAEVLDDFQITDAHYFTMGLFVRFLVERHGFDPLVAFMRDTEYKATRASYEATFAARFGEPLSEAMAAFAGYPTCPEWSNRIALVECGLPLTEWVDGVLDISADVACTSPDVIGPVGTEPMQIAGFAAFEVTTEAKFSLHVMSEIDGFSGVRVTRCGSCWDEIDMNIVAGETDTAVLPVGRYYAAFVTHAEEAGTIRLVVEETP